MLKDIGLASYLDRREIVRSSEGYKLDVLSNDWWGEPLGGMLGRILVVELAQRLPASTIYARAAPSPPIPTPSSASNMQRLDADNAGTLILIAQVAIEFNRPRRLASRTFTLLQAAADTRTPAWWRRSAMPWASWPTASPRCCSRDAAAVVFAGARHSRTEDLARWRAPAGDQTAASRVSRAAACSRSCRRSRPDMRSDCARCGTVLRLTRADPLNRHLALTFAALVLFAVLWLAMLMKVSTAGIVHETTLESGPIELVNRGLWPLALAVAFTTAIAPVIKFVGTIYVLIGLKMQWLPPNLRGVFLVARRMGTWAMLEVLLLGVFVAYTKLGDLVTIELGPAVYALGLLTIVIVWAEIALDPHAVWEEIERRGQTHAPMPALAPLDFRPGAAGCEGCGLVCVPAEGDGRCPRCGSAVHERKPDSVVRTWAFVIAAAILYIPANFYPVLTVMQLGAGEPSTILGGVEELLASQMYPLALLVFFASILVPLFKLIGLAVMLLATQLGGPNRAPPCCCASARGSTTSWPGSAAGRWSTSSWSRCWARWSSSARGHHRARHRRRRLLRRRVHHHLRRRSLRSAPDVGCRGPQRPPPDAVGTRLARHRGGARLQLRAKAKPSLIV